MIAVSYIGWIDDQHHVKASLRLMIHFFASGLIIFSFNGLPPIDFFQWNTNLGIIADAMALIFLVWLLNLFNFMDGIDGIAASQALISSLIVGWIIYLGYNNTNEAYLHWLLSCSVFGFLLFNFPPAKVFMGDVGSGFIGLILGALIIMSANIDSALLWIWIIMLAVFIVDSTYTLAIRFLNGAKVYEAHNLHAYQIAARRYKSHRLVTASVILINLVWLCPIALLVYHKIIFGAFGVILSFVPLFFIARYFKAGVGK
jgi:Fuc2NAc and GlcNAc transferase